MLNEAKSRLIGKNTNKTNLKTGKKLILLFTLLIVHLTFNIENCFSQNWSPLGNGVNDFVYALGTYKNNLIGGGSFTTAGGVSANGIAKWNGTNWNQLGSGLNSTVFTVLEYNNKLYAGGNFSGRISRWNDTTWTLFASPNDWVRALLIQNNALIVCGDFSSIGGISAYRVAKWNDTNWTAFGTGLNDWARALVLYNGELVVGGDFSMAGGVSASRIAKWDGTNWAPLGSGLNDDVYALAVYNNELIAGGLFTTAGGGSANRIAKWNGTSWSSISTGMNGKVNALKVHNNRLIAIGEFTNAGGKTVSKIAAWNGTEWDSLGGGLKPTSSVYGLSLAVYNNELIAGGLFSSAGYLPAKNIAKCYYTQGHDIAAGPFINIPQIINVNSPISVKTKISNPGSYTENSIPVKFFVNGVLINTVYKNLNSFQTDSVSNTWTPTTTGTYNLMYVATVPIDTNRNNDTVRIAVNVGQNLLNACIGTGTSSSTFPFATYSTDCRSQLLFTAAELSAAGALSNSSITKIGFNISSFYEIAMNNFSVKFQHTNLTSLTGFTSTGWTTAYSGTYTIPSTGWQYINMTGPDYFIYNGTSNLLVEICFDNTNYLSNSIVYATTVSNMTWAYSVNNNSGCSMSGGNTYTTRPNTCFVFSVPTGLNNNSEKPDKFSLSQNYPNPFNPVTKINYSIPKQGFVTLKVYDLIGREVRTLVNEVKASGSYSVDFNASELSSGVYFYKIQAGDFTETKKMMLIK